MAPFPFCINSTVWVAEKRLASPVSIGKAGGFPSICSPWQVAHRSWYTAAPAISPSRRRRRFHRRDRVKPGDRVWVLGPRRASAQIVDESVHTGFVDVGEGRHSALSLFHSVHKLRDRQSGEDIDERGKCGR